MSNEHCLTTTVGTEHLANVGTTETGRLGLETLLSLG